VGRDEIDAAFHKPGDEMNVPSQTIEFGDDQSCLGFFRSGYSCSELRPVVPLAAFDFDKFAQQSAAGRCASVAGGAGRRSAAGHAANAGTNTSGAGGLYPIEAWGPDRVVVAPPALDDDSGADLARWSPIIKALDLKIN